MRVKQDRRVVITGVGLISPTGLSAEALWESLTAGRSSVGPITLIPTESLPLKFGAEAREFQGIEAFGELAPDLKKTIRKGLKVMCREIQMGVAAAQRALQDARLSPGAYDPDRTGVSFGCDYLLTTPDEFADAMKASQAGGQFDFDRWAPHGLPNVQPLWLLKYLPNMPASHIAIFNELRGPNNSITQRDASANLAVGEAYCIINRGDADTIICGATGSRIHPFRTLHMLLQEEVARESEAPERVSRPFDRDRTGMVLGEGAAALVLEDRETAERRGATILGEVIGYGSSAVSGPGGKAGCGAAIGNALRQALRTAGKSPDEVGHLHAHGLSTRQSDREEAAAIQAVFGGRKKPIPVVAAKSCFGNLGAGGGMVELVASLLTFQHDTLFPTLNYETPDPECPLAVVHTPGVSPGDSFANVSVSSQGQASVVLVERC